jgi:hypothetical protein
MFYVIYTKEIIFESVGFVLSSSNRKGEPNLPPGDPTAALKPDPKAGASTAAMVRQRSEQECQHRQLRLNDMVQFQTQKQGV